jgi:hypothetical protein
MRHIKRPLISDVLEKAFPLFDENYKKNGKRRTEGENERRAAIKVKRDQQYSQRPKISTI